MPLGISLFIIIVVSFLFSKAARRFHSSEAIGMIIAGLFFSWPLIKEQVISLHLDSIARLSYVGIITLMFLSGFEVSGNMFFKEKRDSFVLTIFTMATSLILGTTVFVILGFSLGSSLVMGICFGITAEATKARVLIQLGKLKSKIGALLMGTGIINDAFGVAALVIITYIFAHNFSWHEIAILAAIILAFFSGMAVHYFFDRFSRKIKIMEKLLLYFIVPFFFVNMGLNFKFDAIFVDYKIIILTVVTASTGQLLGAFLIKPITRLRFKQLFLVGWGMNSKGAVELAIAFVALQAGLIPHNLYSALVATALVTTFLFQIIIFRMVKGEPGIMN